MGNNIILSICIPTFNRSDYLESTILSIVNQARFQQTSDVEIIISDNFSNDDTSKISLGFVEKYGEKVRYYRNDKNIADANFEKVLSYGKGLFLKLNNDTLKHQDGSLDNLLQTITENKETRNILFFSNGALNIDHTIICDDLNSFVKNVSFFSTWIGAFGIWRYDFEHIKDFSRFSNNQLVQTDVLFRLFQYKKPAIINNKELFISIRPNTKGGYDLIRVFLDNYIFLLNEQIKIGLLTKKIVKNEKKKLLLNHICYYMVNTKLNPEQYTFLHNDFFKKIFRHYKNNILTLFLFMLKYNTLLMRSYFKKEK